MSLTCVFWGREGVGDEASLWYGGWQNTFGALGVTRVPLCAQEVPKRPGLATVSGVNSTPGLKKKKTSATSSQAAKKHQLVVLSILPLFLKALFLSLAGIYSVAGKMTPVGDFRPGKSAYFFFHLFRLFCSSDGKQNCPWCLPEAELGFIFSSVGQMWHFFPDMVPFVERNQIDPKISRKSTLGGD